MSERRIIKTSQVTPLEPTANVLNTHSTSQTDTYSADYINNNVGKEIYSTTEQVVGTWIDGRPLYQKTVTVTNSASDYTSTNLTSLGINNADIVIIDVGNSYLTWQNNNYVGYQPVVNIYTTSDFCTAWIYDNALHFKTQTEASRTGYFTLKYTKTTD